MPSSNKRLTVDQRIAAVEWEAHSEKLSNFLRGALGHPALTPHEIPLLFEDVEAALLHLRQTFELMPPRQRASSMHPSAATD